MKKTYFAIILFVFMTMSLVGCSYTSPMASESAANNEETIAVTTTEVTTVVTTEATTSVAYETYSLMGIQFKVPDNWYCEKGSDTFIFYPDKNNGDISMEVGYVGTEKSLMYQCDTVFESFVTELPETEGARVTINKKVSMSEIDFFIGKVDYTTTVYSINTQKYLQFMCDMKTGSFYVFYFSSPDSISEENTRLFNEIVNSVSTDYDF